MTQFLKDVDEIDRAVNYVQLCRLLRSYTQAMNPRQIGCDVGLNVGLNVGNDNNFLLKSYNDHSMGYVD